MAIRSGGDAGGAHGARPTAAGRGDGVARRWWAFEVGALYLSALMLAFAWIVVVRPFVSGAVWGWTWRQRGTYVLMALAQGVFLGPGLAAAALFGWVLLRGMGTDAGPPGPLAWVGYLAALGMLTRHELRWMGRAAVVVP